VRGLLKLHQQQEFSMTISSVVTERRRSNRISVNGEMFLHRGRAMHQIADISEVGLCFRCPVDDELPTEWFAGLVSPLASQNIPGIQVKVVQQRACLAPSFSAMKMKLVAVEFLEMSEEVTQNLTKLLAVLEEAAQTKQHH
jgi:hypothetical protein